MALGDIMTARIVTVHWSETPTFVNWSFVNDGQPVSVPVPSIAVSLGFIVTVLVITAVASLLATRRAAAVDD